MSAGQGHFERAIALCRAFPGMCAGSGGMGGEGGPCAAHREVAAAHDPTAELGRCSGELCGYTLPLVDGLAVGHSKRGTLDVCEGGGRPPLAVPDNQQRAAEVLAACGVEPQFTPTFVAAITAALDDAEARGRAEELDEVIGWLKASGRADAEALTLLRTRAENLR